MSKRKAPGASNTFILSWSLTTSRLWDIKTKMTGAIASMATVKKAKPLEKPAPNPEPPKLGGAMPSGGAADWRSEVKKRDRAKQQEKLNAMPQGMPDYRFVSGMPPGEL